MTATAGDAVAFDLPVWKARVGHALANGWGLEALYWFRPGQIAFQLGGGPEVAFAVLAARRGTFGDPVARTRQLDLDVWALRGELPLAGDPQAQAALARLVRLIDEVDGPTRVWRFPPDEGAGPPGRPGLDVRIPAPCGLWCSFCRPPERAVEAMTFGDEYHSALLATLERARLDGETAVNLRGDEPLAYPRFLELLRAAVAMGFSSVSIYTAGLPLADAKLCGEIVRALPPDHAISVPLYGGRAESHEAITRAPGSFERARVGLGNLRAAGVDGGRVGVSSVALRSNLGDLAPVRDLAEALGFGFLPHLPRPSAHIDDAGCGRLMARETDVVATLHGLPRPIKLAEAHPCVLLRHELATGVPSFSRLRAADWAPAPWPARLDRYAAPERAGTLPEAPGAVPCASVGRCLLSGSCTRVLHRGYLETHGADEFRPVELDELRRVATRTAAPPRGAASSP